jgi:hypothetical protein
MSEMAKRRTREITVSTIGAVAEFFGVHERTVRHWRERMTADGISSGASGKWNLSAFANWAIARRDTIADNDLARRRRAEADLFERRAEKMELDLAKERGQILDADAVEVFFGHELQRLADGLSGIAEEVAMNVPDDRRDDVEAAVEERIDRLLTAFAECDPGGTLGNGHAMESELCAEK